MGKQPPDWLQTVRRLLEDISDSDVTELEVAQRELRLRVKRRPRAGSTVALSAVSDSAAPGQIQIRAPLTGVFYRASSQGSEPYVREGDWTQAGATVGLIETMKIFNEVKTEQSGRIDRILVQSGQLVQAGEALILFTPGEPPPSAPNSASF